MKFIVPRIKGMKDELALAKLFHSEHKKAYEKQTQDAKSVSIRDDGNKIGVKT